MADVEALGRETVQGRRKSVEQGNDAAMNELDDVSADGLGVAPDYGAALGW